VLPAAVALLLCCAAAATPTERSEASSFGRDADTIAAVVGGLVGALHG
jgi:ADP-ribosylglycohydrolase